MMFARDKKQKEKERGAQPRPRVRPVWRRGWVVPIFTALIMGIAGGGGWRRRAGPLGGDLDHGPNGLSRQRSHGQRSSADVPQNLDRYPERCARCADPGI